MARAGVSALWEREASGRPGLEPPHRWAWAELDPLLDQAVAAAGIEHAERRVLVLENPAYGATHRRGAGINMVVNLQILMPGEEAAPHRHTANALRFILEGDGGAVTTVNGVPCAMNPGDFLLTPGWCWHEHSHKGEGRAVWLDALDVPLHDHFGIHLFEAGPSNDVAPPADSAAHASVGVTPVGGRDAAQPYSPVFKTPLKDVLRALNAMTPAEDGARRVRYTNPLTGGAAMPGLDCYMLMPPAGRHSRAYRTNANMVCLAVKGSGTAQAGETEIRWSEKDIFTLPRGHWISHRADGGDALLFQLTDREILYRLDYLREEFRD